MSFVRECRAVIGCFLFRGKMYPGSLVVFSLFFIKLYKVIKLLDFFSCCCFSALSLLVFSSMSVGWGFGCPCSRFNGVLCC